MRLRNLHGVGILGTALLSSLPSVAQEQQRPGRVAESAVGEAGQRQTREQSQTNIEPTARINNRIANRVQNRIQNRIDRSYRPQSGTTTSFEIAADQERTANSPRQR